MTKALLVGAAMAILAAAPAGAATVWAVGDGAYSGSNDDRVVNLIASGSPDRFLYLGDVYESGTEAEYRNYYAPSYGRLKAVTKPTPGNHEWSNRAKGYDPYWGVAYSDPHYYSFDIDGWHLVGLNSEEPHGEGSPQLSWLRGDLARHAGSCTLAYWHRPRFSVGGHGDQSDADPLWRALAGHATIVLSGHEHNYQRLKPIDGITQFVVGTGGKHLSNIAGKADPRLAFSTSGAYGALRLLLAPGVAGADFYDAGGNRLDSTRIDCLDRTAPAFSKIALARRIRSGTRPRLRFTLSEAGTVELIVERRSKRRFHAAFAIKRKLAGGRQTLRIPRRQLTRGSFRLVLRADDPAGNASVPRRLKLRVLPPI